MAKEDTSLKTKSYEMIEIPSDCLTSALLHETLGWVESSLYWTLHCSWRLDIRKLKRLNFDIVETRLPDDGWSDKLEKYPIDVIS